MDPEVEKNLKTSFVGAANQLTQLYTHSLQLQKQAYSSGYQKSTRETLDWVLKQSANGHRSVSVDELAQILRSRLESSPESKRSTDEPVSTPTRSTSSMETFNVFGTSQTFPSFEMSPQFPNNFSQTQNQSQQANPFQFVPPVQGQNSFSQQNGNYQHQMEARHKRTYEQPNNTMEFCYPDQYNKRTKINSEF